MAGVGSLVVTSNGMIRVIAMVPSLRQGQAALLRGVGVGVGVSSASAEAEKMTSLAPRPFAVRSQIPMDETRMVRPATETQSVGAVQVRPAEVVLVEDKPPQKTGVERRAEERADPVLAAEEETRRRRADAIDALLRQFERKREDMGDASLGLDNRAKRGQVVAMFGMFQPAGQKERSGLNLVG